MKTIQGDTGKSRERKPVRVRRGLRLTSGAASGSAQGTGRYAVTPPPSLRRRAVEVPVESAQALAHVVAAADLAESGRIRVTSTRDMSRDDFLALLKASAPLS